MKRYTENNMVLINRKCAKKQLRNIAALILEENGVLVRKKKSIRVSYPGEFLNVDWVKDGFNDDFEEPEIRDDSLAYHVDLKDKSYKVHYGKVFEDGWDIYYKDLYIKLEVKDCIYDAKTDRTYDVCEVKAWIERGELDGSLRYEKTVVDFETFSDLNEICLNEIYAGRKKQLDRFNLIGEKERCIKQLEAIVTKSINELAKKYGLEIYSNPGLEFENNIIQSSTCFIKDENQQIECNLSFRELPTSNSETICIELYLIDVNLKTLSYCVEEEDCCLALALEKYLKKVINESIK